MLANTQKLDLISATGTYCRNAQKFEDMATKMNIGKVLEFIKKNGCQSLADLILKQADFVGLRKGFSQKIHSTAALYFLIFIHMTVAFIINQLYAPALLMCFKIRTK